MRILPNDALNLLQPHVLFASNVVCWSPSPDVPVVAALAHNGHLVGPPNKRDNAQPYATVLDYGLAYLLCIKRLLVFRVAKLSPIDVYHGGHAYNASFGCLLRPPHDHVCCPTDLS
jgi:hypothetical protein